MLSRVAENIYWMARYIERAEDTARLINVNTHLQLDLPRRVRFGWGPLIAILGGYEQFADNYEQADERSVMRYLISDRRHPGSILSALYLAREDARTIRDIIPREAWEQINNLFLEAKAGVQSALTRRHRYDYLRRIILGAQSITGLLAGTMTHDAGYQFLRMGRNLERGDMTTRIIDVRSANLLLEQGDELAPFENIQWMSVLKSLTAYQMYRRKMQVRVRRPDVLRFLLQDADFPRSVYHTVCEVEACLRHLARSDLVLRTIAQLQRTITEAQPGDLSQEDLHAFIDDLQCRFGELHAQIAETYFVVSTESAAASAAA